MRFFRWLGRTITVFGAICLICLLLGTFICVLFIGAVLDLAAIGWIFGH